MYIIYMYIYKSDMLLYIYYIFRFVIQKVRLIQLLIFFTSSLFQFSLKEVYEIVDFA